VSVFLLGEGSGDVGRAGDRRGKPCDFEGDLPRLVRRVVELTRQKPGFGYVAETIYAVNQRVGSAGRPTRVGGKSKELLTAVLAALQTHATVIALIDARDGEVAELERDVRDILELCRSRRTDARVAIGLAIQEIEIWMLADPEARKAAFGPSIGALDVPADLEAEGNPKRLWQERAGQAPSRGGKERGLHADDQRLAAWLTMNPTVVAHRCPRGFGPFHRDLVNALT
jgi:uncharacterized membrane protein